jgi:hypothetical protein
MLFFWNKGKKDAAKAGKKRGASGAKAAAAKTGAGAKGKAPSAKTATKPQASAKSQAPAKSQASAKKAAGKQAAGGVSESRAQAEAQIQRMLSDGSLDKVKTIMEARDPQTVVDKYPRETVNTIRSWLNDTKS